MYTQDIYITESHVKAIDQPTRPCTNEASSLSTSKCLANFIERKIGCTPNIQGSQYPKGLPCNTKSQLLDLANITMLFQEADENEDADETCTLFCNNENTKNTFVCWQMPPSHRIFNLFFHAHILNIKILLINIHNYNIKEAGILSIL